MVSRSFKVSKKWKIISIILLWYSGMVFIGAIAFGYTFRPVSEENTTHYHGTIKEIDSFGSFRIRIIENMATFSITYEKIVLDMDALQNLKNGQAISFRIQTNKTDVINEETENIFLVSLESNGIEIITIESYNKIYGKMQIEATVGFTILGSLFLIGGILSMRKHKKSVLR